MMQIRMLVAGTTLATLLGTGLAGTGVAQPMDPYGQPAVTTRTVTTVTTTRNVPPGSYAGPREGQVVYDGEGHDGPPPAAGRLFYPETHVWQAAPGEFPRDWQYRHRPVQQTRVSTRRPIVQTRVARHPRRDYVEVRDDSGRPVPVMVQVVAPDGYRDTVPAVIRPSGVPTVVRATGDNPPPVYYATRTTEVGEPGMLSPQGGPGAGGESINWAQERQQGMPGHWDYQGWDRDHWHDAPPPPPSGSDWDR